MGSYNFVADLRKAKESEKEISKLLVEKFSATIVDDENNTNTHDIHAIINNKSYLFEVKEDFMVGDTGNVAVEFSCRGKPSGIETSKADFYIYILHLKECIKHVIIPLSRLKKSIDREHYIKIVNGGDYGSNTMMYLYKLPMFASLGKWIEDNPILSEV